MRILHTSDWHIGRQFHNVSLLEDQRHVLNQIIEIISDRKIDVVIISGDIYDRSVPPADAVALLDYVINKINQELNVPIVMISGNHDGGIRLSFGARQLARSGVHISGQLTDPPEPVILEDESGEVAFYCLPYADPATVRDVFDVDVHDHDEAMKEIISRVNAHIKSEKGNNRRNVVLSHCFVDGCSSSESERPLSVGGADRVSADYFKDFDYAALGHLHGPQYKGAEHVRYSGSILKYSFSEEKQKKSVTLVEMANDGQCDIEKIPLVPLRDMRIIEGALDDILEQGKTDPKSEDYVLVRLLDTHAILDVMGKLRVVYPNVLHLERPTLAEGGERKTPDREQLQKGEMPMFLDFYQQMTGEELDKESNVIIADILDNIHKGEES